MISDEEVKKGLMMLNIIWFAILMSLVIYLFVGFQVKETLQTSLNADSFSIIRSVLYMIAFITLILTRFIKKFFLSVKSGRNLNVPGRRDLAQNPVLRKYMIAMIIAWAMSESVGIYGLVLFFIGKNLMDLYLLIGVSAVALCFYRPNRDEIINLSRNLEPDGSVE